MAKKILIVDDDPIIVKYLDNLFKDNGYETCIAENGTQAYDVLVAEKPDLISLDLEMPEEWGPRFYRKMSKNSEYKNTPVIVVSGMASRHLSIKNLVASFAKPFDPDKLIEAIKGAIGEPDSE